MAREAGEVHLVNDGRGKIPTQRLITLPIVSAGIEHRAFHGDRAALSVSARAVAGIRLGHDHGAPVRVEQSLARIETQALLGIEGAEGAIGVELSGADAGHENVPVVVRTVLARIERNHMRRMRVRSTIEK